MGSKTGETGNSESEEESESVKYALVTFLKDSVSQVVPIEVLKVDRNEQENFNPINCSDFDPKHKYYMRWYYCNQEGYKCEDAECDHEFDIYSAFIRCLGETKESVKLKFKGKRIPPTNKKYVSTTDDEVANFEEVDEVLELKKVKEEIQNKKKVAQKARDDKVLEKLKNCFKLPVFSDSQNKVKVVLPILW